MRITKMMGGLYGELLFYWDETGIRLMLRREWYGPMPPPLVEVEVHES
jgi:hypothetical protein